jgi:regulation of enolase protein 1 (concanavalin A-like superfamily)
LTAPAGSNHDPGYGGVDNATRVMQKIGSGDFTAEVKFNSIPRSQYQFEGIMVDQDAANYLRFHIGSTGSVLVVGAGKMIAHNETDLQESVISVPNGSSIWMRIQKAGNTWTQSWSADGSTYRTVGSFTHALTPSVIGPMSGNYNNNPGASPGFIAAVDYFFNTANRLAP